MQFRLRTLLLIVLVVAVFLAVARHYRGGALLVFGLAVGPILACGAIFIGLPLSALAYAFHKLQLTKRLLAASMLGILLGIVGLGSHIIFAFSDYRVVDEAVSPNGKLTAHLEIAREPFFNTFDYSARLRVFDTNTGAEMFTREWREFSSGLSLVPVSVAWTDSEFVIFKIEDRTEEMVEVPKPYR